MYALYDNVQLSDCSLLFMRAVCLENRDPNISNLAKEKEKYLNKSQQTKAVGSKQITKENMCTCCMTSQTMGCAYTYLCEREFLYIFVFGYDMVVTAFF